MNREEHHREHIKITEAFKRTDQNFKNVDIHVGEQLKRLTKLQMTIDEMYANALTRDRMWDALLGILDRKGLLTKIELDEELKAINDALVKAYEEQEAKKKAAEAEKLPPEGKVTVLSDVPAIPVVK